MGLRTRNAVRQRNSPGSGAQLLFAYDSLMVEKVESPVEPTNYITEVLNCHTKFEFKTNQNSLSF